MTKIEWVKNRDGSQGVTWNPIRHKDGGHACIKTSKGCEFCYSERMQPRFGQSRHFNARSVEGLYLDERVLMQPLKWRKPKTAFVCSMTDLFGEWVPPEWIREIFDVMGAAKAHTFQVLTKRPERIEPMLYGESSNWYLGGGDYYPHIWLGFSAEDQTRYDERINPMLSLASQGWLTWASLEPLLGPIDLRFHCSDCGYTERDERIHGDHYLCGWPLPKSLRWIVAGGESGPKARPCHPDWARGIRDQCQAAAVPFHWKQQGAWIPCSIKENIGAFKRGRPTGFFSETGEWLGGLIAPLSGLPMLRVGKKAAGRLLDGRTWDEFPEEAR